MQRSLGARASAASLGLRRLILDGELRAGDRLVQQQLSLRLGVSRGPLRLALAQLQIDGLAEPGAGGGLVVSSFDWRRVTDLIDLRGVLEGSAARRAALRDPAASPLAYLEYCVEKGDELVNNRAEVSVSTYAGLNDEFHAELFAIADSDLLTTAYEHVLAVPFAAPSAFLSMRSRLDLKRTRISQAEHRAILQAIKRGDAESAERLVREHARASKRAFMRAFRAGPDGLHGLAGNALVTCVDVGVEVPKQTHTSPALRAGTTEPAAFAHLAAVSDAR